MTHTHPDPDNVGSDKLENSQTIQTLREDGPQPADAVEPSYAQRREFVSKFQLSTARNSTNAITSRGRQGVWYLRDVHTPEEVLDVWLDTNADIVEQADSHRIWYRIREHGPEWGDYFRDQVGFERRAGGSGGEHEPDKECPLCGEDELYTLADHLPDCPERDGGDEE